MSDGCLGCVRCEDGPVVTLEDGRTVCRMCEDYRHECEARAVMNMPSRRQRVEYIEMVSKHRGKAEATRLHDTVLVMWERRSRRSAITPAVTQTP